MNRFEKLSPGVCDNAPRNVFREKLKELNSSINCLYLHVGVDGFSLFLKHCRSGGLSRWLNTLSRLHSETDQLETSPDKWKNYTLKLVRNARIRSVVTRIIFKNNRDYFARPEHAYCLCGSLVYKKRRHGRKCRKGAGRYVRYTELNIIIKRVLVFVIPAVLEPFCLARDDDKRAGDMH